MQWLTHAVTLVLTRWGYLALAGCLLGESAGLPLPGETVLMYASFVAHKTHQLSVVLIILVGVAAAVVGDNLGYFAGKYAGNHILRWMKRKFNLDADVSAANELMQRHGGATVFWARYIFGLRTIAGPVAGTLNMKWRKFLLYNVLGASCWVTSVALVGFFFANQMHSLAGFIEKVSWGVSGALFATGYFIWRSAKND